LWREYGFSRVDGDQSCFGIGALVVALDEVSIAAIKSLG
jgi:hypothetical protein